MASNIEEIHQGSRAIPSSCKYIIHKWLYSTILSTIAPLFNSFSVLITLLCVCVCVCEIIPGFLNYIIEWLQITELSPSFHAQQLSVEKSFLIVKSILILSTSMLSALRKKH